MKESVPDYHAEIFSSAPEKSHVVFIFAFNEGSRLRDQLARFPENNLGSFDIMVGDDGSDDGCCDEMILRAHGVRGVVRLPTNQGLSANIKAGLDWLLNSSKYQSVIMMNGNNKDDPAAIGSFMEKLEEGYGYVQGSRFRPGGRRKNTPLVRHLAIRWIHAPLFSLASRRWMTDTTNGFRAFSRAFLEDERVHPFQEIFQQYELEQYLAWKALRLGYPCSEIPVARDYPEPDAGGKVQVVSKIAGGGAHWQMIKPLLAINLGWYE